MTIGTLEILDTAAATKRYEELVARVGDLETFKTRGGAFELDAAEAALYDELCDLEFLLERD